LTRTIAERQNTASADVRGLCHNLTQQITKSKSKNETFICMQQSKNCMQQTNVGISALARGMSEKFRGCTTCRFLRHAVILRFKGPLTAFSTFVINHTSA